MVSKASKFLNGWRLVFTMALVKPENGGALGVHSLGSDQQPAGAPPVPSNPPQPAASTPAPVVTLAGLVADSRFKWRKLATIASKLGTTVTIVKADIIAAGGKIDRTGTLVKTGSVAPNGWQSAATDNADDAEEDDYNEFDDEEGDAELDDEFDGDEESDDEEFDDEEDVAEFAAPVAPTAPVYDATIVGKLRDLLQSPNYRWRKLPTLAQSVQLSETETKRYLAHIGARESRRGGLFRS